MQDLISVVDADDTLLRTGDTKLRYMREHFPSQSKIEGIEPYNCSRTALVPIIGLEFYDQMNTHIKSREPTLATPPLDGALDGIIELSKLVQIHILSARTPEETQFVREWMEKYGIDPYVVDVSSAEDPKYDNVPEVSGKKKVDVALYLGAALFVDDDERHMPKRQVGGLHFLLFGKGERNNVASHITIARTWEDVVAYARQLVPILYN